MPARLAFDLKRAGSAASHKGREVAARTANLIQIQTKSENKKQLKQKNQRQVTRPDFGNQSPINA